MKNIDSKGFGILGVIIVLTAVGLIGFGGWTVWREANKTNQEPAQQMSSDKSQKQSNPATDEQLVTKVVRNQCEADSEGTWTGWSKTPPNPDGKLEFSTDNNFARGSTGCIPRGVTEPGGDGYAVILKKTDGVWGIVFAGTMAPGKEWAEKYGAPEGWYSEDY